MQKLDSILAAVKEELIRAKTKHPRPASSAHEMHSVLREEVEELWDHVKADTGYGPAARAEAIQVAAMAIRYALEVSQ